MSNLHWSKMVSISVSFILTLLSLCGVLVLATPDVTFPDGFLVVWGYAIPAVVCSIAGKHKAAIVFGFGGIAAGIASWLALLLLNNRDQFSTSDQLMFWHGKPVGLVVMGFVFICGLLGATTSFAIMRSIKNKK